MSDPSITDLVQQGLAAARVGDVDDARRLLTKATQQTPYNIEAWLGLAGVVVSLKEKKRCFNKVLTLDPNNQDAKAGLALVEQKLAAQEADSNAFPSVSDSSHDGPGVSTVKRVEAPLLSEDKETEAATIPTDTGLLFCYRHPHTETGLRCNRCDKPICPKCAQRTPVGFRCPDCIREQEDKYYSGSNVDYIIAVVIALPLSLITAGLFTFVLGGLGFFFTIIIGIFAGPFAGGIIAESVRWGVRRRRSRYLGRIVAACLIVSTVLFALPLLLAGGFFGLIGPGLLLFLGTPTILARLR